MLIDVSTMNIACLESSRTRIHMKPISCPVFVLSSDPRVRFCYAVERLILFLIQTLFHFCREQIISSLSLNGMSCLPYYEELGRFLVTSANINPAATLTFKLSTPSSSILFRLIVM
jgi:hypothetical protein